LDGYPPPSNMARNIGRGPSYNNGNIGRVFGQHGYVVPRHVYCPRPTASGNIHPSGLHNCVLPSNPSNISLIICLGQQCPKPQNVDLDIVARKSIYVNNVW
jgi:hypothetical protein